jgi:hypothetical protein
MKERTDIVGMRLRCKACNALFAIGSDGVEPARNRVMDHYKVCGGMMDVRPVNTRRSRPKGLTYVGAKGTPVIVYDGKNWDKFWSDVMTASRTFFTVMSPKLELTK